MPRVLRQRCFYLFILLVLLIALGPLGTHSVVGRVIVDLVNYAILLAAIAAVGRTRAALVWAIVLAIATMGSEIAAAIHQSPRLLVASLAFGAVFYVVSLSHLLRYVFRREGLTEDKLYGAAAAYLMLGILWTYLYGLVQWAIPGSFSGRESGVLSLVDLVYFSFTVLTSTGFGDIVPLSPLARSLAVLEQTAGVLFVAILIARVAGIYVPSGGSIASGVEQPGNGDRDDRP